MRATVFIAASLDGFIARENGGIDWLDNDGAEQTNEDYGFKAFMDTVDAIIMGRNTFEVLLSLEGWIYGQTPLFVLSSGDVKIPSHLAQQVKKMAGSPAEILKQLSEQGFEHVYVDGGKTIQRFLNQGLINRMVITRIPILIGSGIPLFGPLAHDIKLRHIDTLTYPDSLVQSFYEVLV